MIGLALILLPAGYVLVYTGFAGDGNPPGADGKKTYSLANAFRNALSGSLLKPHIAGRTAQDNAAAKAAQGTAVAPNVVPGSGNAKGQYVPINPNSGTVDKHGNPVDPYTGRPVVHVGV